jgi:hypothetical protein
MSKEKYLNDIFSKIAGTADPTSLLAQPGTGLAEPGDLFFFITHYPNRTLRSEVNSNLFRKAIRIMIRSRMREWYGYDRNDFDDWHVGIYNEGRKRKDHQRINLWMFHSHPPAGTETGGVHLQHLAPGEFSRPLPNSQGRMEILQFDGLTNEQRKRIVEFASSKVGLKFDFSVEKHALTTCAFGLPNVLHNPNRYACQQLVIDAYAAAGIYFPHPYKSFPIFNIGRLLGHPLGHPKDRVDPRYPYLMDHHIYRDPRFKVKAILYEDPISRKRILKTENLEKYSWNPKWKEKYLSGMNLDKS